MDFFIANINSILHTNLTLLHLALPLAISFFTLQQISFLVDSYKGIVKKVNFLNYALFVTFFPQLIAGPIVHYKEMLPQFELLKNKFINYQNISKGLFLFSIGLFKKVVIADTFAIYATYGFDTATTLNLFEAWATSLSYTFQLYFDFSGYTDMAIGIALLFNIKLPINFNSPYKAFNLQDLWKRWHMSLTRFITNYIYTPLTMSFKKITIAKAMLATFITFLIVGMWHGASWLFIFWGGLHGIGLVINYYWQKKSKYKINIFWSWFLTFNYFSLLLVFFRAKDLNQAIKVLEGMFGFGDSIFLQGLTFEILTAHTNIDLLSIAFIVGGFIVTVFLPNSNELLERFKANIITFFFTVILFIYSILNINKYSEFLYFNF